MENIQITLPDGSTREVARGTTAAQIAGQIGPRLASAALVARAGDTLVDLSKPLEESTKLSILTAKDPDAVQVFRHSAAHLLAAAVLELYPDVKLGIGPPTDTGFFYEFVREQPFTQDDLAKIEAKMHEIAAKNVPNERKWLPKGEALDLYRRSGQPFKCELVEEKAVEPMVSFYTTGKFIDFCRGPHIPSTGRIQAFKLMNVAGAYWKGHEGNPQMQRIYGACFVEQKELDEYLHRLEEAKRRDHRKLGTELDLFSIQDEAGPGLIFWHPKGAIIRREMEDWLRAALLRRGYDLVFTPHIMRLDLWKTSGHANFYRENMFGPIEVEKAEYQLKPMNCPGHILIYKSKLRSYRELPVRLAELGTVYRYERSGVLHGLMRVRGFTQDDAHIFCMREQIEHEVQDCVEFAWEVLKTFGFDRYEVELSGGDPSHPEVYAGTPEDWEHAENALKNTLERMNVPYKYIAGEAAFYGPKIDVKLVDAIGRPWQLSTVQFDFNLPRRFNLEYVGEDGSRHMPLMVHRALWGSVERFFGVLIEHYAGAFPAWLAPVQASVLPVSGKFEDYARKVTSELKAAGVRVHLDDRNEKLQAKIRDAQLEKIPYMLILGGKEAEAGTVSVRHRSKGDLGPRPLAQFIADLKAEIEEHRFSDPAAAAAVEKGANT
ncbi:MAG TPA: threonine--tRNA ligase [Candidatus Aquilonibacter sp.]|nr:threonine--tRNA ligase [Candidatus Aquilonibacter sp.]